MPIINAENIDEFLLRDNKLYWEFAEEEKIYRYWISQEYFLVEKFEIEESNRLILRCKLQKFRPIEDVFIPKLIQIYFPPRKSMFAIFYEDQTIERK